MSALNVNQAWRCCYVVVVDDLSQLSRRFINWMSDSMLTKLMHHGLELEFQPTTVLSTMVRPSFRALSLYCSALFRKKQTQRNTKPHKQTNKPTQTNDLFPS